MDPRKFLFLLVGSSGDVEYIGRECFGEVFFGIAGSVCTEEAGVGRATLLAAIDSCFLVWIDLVDQSVAPEQPNPFRHYRFVGVASLAVVVRVAIARFGEAVDLG